MVKTNSTLPRNVQPSPRTLAPLHHKKKETQETGEKAALAQVLDINISDMKHGMRK